MSEVLTDYIVGLDLGQASDYSAMAVLERRTPRDDQPVTHAIRHLKRWPLGTPYPRIVDDVSELLYSRPLLEADLVVDQTGVGRPVLDLFRAEIDSSRLKPVVVTAGQTATLAEDGSWHVPKKELVSALQVLLQARTLAIARELELAEVLVRELQMFRVKITAAGNESFEACERDHDDLVLAVAFAAWRSRRTTPSFPEDHEPAILWTQRGKRYY